MRNIAKGFEFKKFATPRIIGGIAIVVIVLWALSIIFNASDGPTSKSSPAGQQTPVAATTHSGTKDPSKTPEAAHQSRATGAVKRHGGATEDNTENESPAVHDTTTGHEAPAVHETTDSDATATHDDSGAREPAAGHAMTKGQETAGSDGATATQKTAVKAPSAEPAKHQQPATATHHDVKTSSHGAADKAATQHAAAPGHPIADTAVGAAVHKPKPKGVAFVEATIQPLSYELEDRWWGWRPNDLINVTDNVNTFQMGVLEVTRRATVALAERISRTGTTDAFDENLEQAMNWFMVKASSYWFPSAESKYSDGLEELKAYLEKLRQGKATFYTRTDNLIPLLASFEDLLGSCDENLVKETNEDGTPLSTFDADDYFYYTQGVASAMATVLEAVHHDFLITLESRNATELLHHAIVSCQRASELDPWIVLDRSLSSIFANHRANMAAPISHARFFLGQLIKTLST